MFRYSQGVLRLTHQTRSLAVCSFIHPRRAYITASDYSEGTHHVATNQLDELLSHLESTKVSDPRTVSSK